jgi:hypothetical protein
MSTFKLYIEGPDEDHEFTYKSLDRAEDRFNKWCRDKRNSVALFQAQDNVWVCIRTNDPDGYNPVGKTFERA